MKAIVITIMLQVAIAAALIASTSQPTALPFAPAKLSQVSQTTPAQGAFDSTASDQDLRRKSFVIAAQPPPPTPTLTPTPCPCPPSPPGPNYYGVVACGDGCTSRPCVYPCSGTTSDTDTCAQAHENVHANDPQMFCYNGWGCYNNDDSTACECRAFTEECSCMNAAVSGDTAGTAESNANIARRNQVCGLARDTCSAVGQPTPGPTTTPMPSVP